MTSGGRELLKWLALVLMTGDHVVKVLELGYVPVVSELGRVAFPVFALVMGFNLAQSRANTSKSVQRLATWGIVATPVAVLAFGQLLPLNVLLTFAAAAACVWAIERRYWMLVAFLAVIAPAWLDYAWPGVWLVLAGWRWYRGQGGHPWLVWGCMGLLCAYNGSAWALLAIPALRLGHFNVAVPRSGKVFYGYYVAHLALLSGVVAFAGGSTALLG
ncbi:TraX family protein [Stenotrophomonas maltophilia]|uniref:Conjugal transfer protein n=1 Tax=Stenotrophomonas maltophilia TaxID=40324 RepID=A0AAP7GRE1_STEMA|nr:TraX family protein [Stenotrophomonas maltophilia]OBU61231.1 conjugal transfer protein [Stenotrophomonas maltophilia]